MFEYLIEILSDFDDHVKALDSIFNGTYSILSRMRLSCTFQVGDGTSANQKGEGTPATFTV
jgi:hypothetical protein